MVTLTPAYGRDYKSKSAAVSDYKAGKDFIINQYGHPYDGKPCSIRDMEGRAVSIRYNGLRSVTVVNGHQFP